MKRVIRGVVAVSMALEGVLGVVETATVEMNRVKPDPLRRVDVLKWMPKPLEIKKGICENGLAYVKNMQKKPSEGVVEGFLVESINVDCSWFVACIGKEEGVLQNRNLKKEDMKNFYRIFINLTKIEDTLDEYVLEEIRTFLKENTGVLDRTIKYLQCMANIFIVEIYLDVEEREKNIADYLEEVEGSNLFAYGSALLTDRTKKLLEIIRSCKDKKTRKNLVRNLIEDELAYVEGVFMSFQFEWIYSKFINYVDEESANSLFLIRDRLTYKFIYNSFFQIRKYQEITFSDLKSICSLSNILIMNFQIIEAIAQCDEIWHYPMVVITTTSKPENTLLIIKYRKSNGERGIRVSDVKSPAMDTIITGRTIEKIESIVPRGILKKRAPKI